QPTFEFFRPIARSMPCTGNGVKTSQRVKPALRTAWAACMMEAGFGNSAITPYGLVVPFRLFVLVRHSFFLFRAAERMMRIRLRCHALHFRNRNHRQKTDEQEEIGEKQSERAEKRADIHPRRLEITPTARQEIAMQ